MTKRATPAGCPSSLRLRKKLQLQGLRILRSEAYNRYAAATKDERNAADGLFPKPYLPRKGFITIYVTYAIIAEAGMVRTHAMRIR